MVLACPMCGATGWHVQAATGALDDAWLGYDVRCQAGHRWVLQLVLVPVAGSRDVAQVALQCTEGVHAVTGPCQCGDPGCPWCGQAYTDTDDDADDAPTCQVCGGVLAYLGRLGTRAHYRCTACGLDQSMMADDADPEDAEP